MESMVRGIALALTLIVLSGCGGGSDAGAGTVVPGRRISVPGGLSIRVPPHWHVAPRLTALFAPKERLTIASFSLRTAPVARRGCAPTTALAHMPRDGALAFLFEYTTPSPAGVEPRGIAFPARPRHFRLPTAAATQYECFGRGWLLRFRDGRRRFQLMIAGGRRAAGNLRTLVSALDTLRVDAAHKEG